LIGGKFCPTTIFLLLRLSFRAKVRLCLKQNDVMISSYRLNIMYIELLVWFLIRKIHGEWVKQEQITVREKVI